MANKKDTSEDITPSTTEASPAVPAGGAGIPASAFDADLAAAKEAQDAEAERVKSYEVEDNPNLKDIPPAEEEADQTTGEEG